MTFLHSVYRNGNYFVIQKGRCSLEKRCFRINEPLTPDFPDSIDLKISNRCSIGCPYCHEESIPAGGLADFDEIKKHLDSLPNKPIEVAIGGGDLVEDDESFELLKNVIIWLTERNIRASLTINEKSLNHVTFPKIISLKPHGLGISLGPGITEQRLLDIKDILTDEPFFRSTTTLVYHIILGMFPVDILKRILNVDNRSGLLEFGNNRVLFLGYKQFGRAKQTPLPDTIPVFESIIKRCILRQRELPNDMFSSITLGFDNLAVDQINLEGALLDTEFGDIFLGPEFSCSMYVDAVKGQYAESSTSTNRVDWNSIDIIDYFKHDKN